jgi:hypothetical protein
MSGLDQVLPTPRLLEIDDAEVVLSLDAAWDLLRHGDLLRRSAIARLLFAIRTFSPEEMSLSLDDLRSTPERPGFQVLIDLPPHEVVVGAIGKVWQADIPFLHVADADEFAAVSAPGWVKVAWTIRLVAVELRRTRVEVELRVDATDDASWRKFRRYFRVIGPGSRFIRRSLLASLAREYGADEPRDDWRDVAEGVSGAAIMLAAFATPFLRSARAHWGMERAAAARPYPGDDLVKEPRWSWTHGIEIDAPEGEVWPWVAQIGADRAGFYSYQWLENLAGCHIQNAESLHPEWVERGGLLLHPNRPPLEISSIVPGRFFVAHAAAERMETSWLFFVEALPNGRSRFISRYRCACSDDLATRLAFGPTLVEPIGFAMDRRMLLGVKERVEHARYAAS